MSRTGCCCARGGCPAASFAPGASVAVCELWCELSFLVRWTCSALVRVSKPISVGGSRSVVGLCWWARILGSCVCVTRRNSGNRCYSASNSRKPKKAHSKTESRPTSADQQHRTEAHEQGPKQPATARSTQRAPERRKQCNTQHRTWFECVCRSCCWDWLSCEVG